MGVLSPVSQGLCGIKKLVFCGSGGGPFVSAKGPKTIFARCGPSDFLRSLPHLAAAQLAKGVVKQPLRSDNARRGPDFGFAARPHRRREKKMREEVGYDSPSCPGSDLEVYPVRG